MTFYDDLETVIEAKIESEYNATLADIGDAVPFNLSLPELLKIRDYLKTQSVSIVGNITNTVIRATSAQQTRAANTTPYSVFDSYGGIGILTGLVSGGSYVLQSFELAIDIAAIPSSMALSVMFFDSQSAAQSSGSFIADNALTTNVIPNSFADSRGIPLTLAVVAGKVIAHTGAINRIIKLASGQTSLHFYIMATAAFTPAANSETMNAKAVLGTY